MAIGAAAQIADPQLQDLKEPIRINDTSDTTTVLTLSTIFFSFRDFGLGCSQLLSTADNLYDLKKICLFLARSRL